MKDLTELRSSMVDTLGREKAGVQICGVYYGTFGIKDIQHK